MNQARIKIVRIPLVFMLAISCVAVFAQVPVLPDEHYNYANVDLPSHFTNLNTPGGSVVSNDNTPVNNPITDAGATLGRVLFYDKRLSANDSVSCSSCHQQEHGFSDPDILSTGFEDGLTGRHSMGLSNARFYEPGHFFWDERADTLEDQVLMPIQDPVEMGMDLDVLVPKLAATDFYPGLFESAFGSSDITADRISLALAQFVRSLVSYQSKFDLAFANGVGGGPDFEGTFSDSELLGEQLFNNPPGSPVQSLECFLCHGTTGHISDDVENNGLDANTSDDQGAGNGQFKAPSLRDIAARAPYMHDGRFETLEEVVEFYNSGIQPHPRLSNRLQDQNGQPVRFNMTDAEKAGLVAFMETLTDPFFLNDIKFSDPFTEPVASLDVFSGSWVDSTRGGEGWIIEVIDDASAVIFWFTFDENGDRTWLVGIAQRDGNTLSANMLLADGPVFGAGFDQANVTYQDWGTLAITFTSCRTSELQYASNLPAFGSGSLSPERLVGIDGLDCAQPSNAASNRFSGWSGSWIDLEHGGEGWIIEVIDEDTAVIFWFTFDENGDRVWLIGVADPNGQTLAADMLLASGPVFGAGFNQNDVSYTSWGTLEITFDDCGTASAVYASTVGGYGSGTMQPNRLTSLAGLDCNEAPNILLVIADDFGLDALSVYGVSAIQADTPVLNELAAEGLVFDQFWANPTCSPTRASLITGQHGFHTDVFEPGDNLADTELSVQDYLEQELPGIYSNAVVGKWHISRPNDLDHPEQMGVQHFAGILSGTFEDYNNWILTQNGVQSPETDYITSKYVDLSLDWIKDQSQPWFLWLAMTAPHEPFHLPPAHLHGRDLTGTEADINANPLDYYQAMIEAMDAEIGRLLEGLDENTRDNTIIIFMGDNGTPRRVIQAPYINSQGKGSLYQGGVNVPLFVSGAGVDRKGQRDESLVGVTDLFATISEIAGIEFDVPNDSISFYNLFKTQSIGTREFLYADAIDEEVKSWAVRNDRYKLIEDDLGNREIYDLALDEFENIDMVASGSVPAGVLQELIAIAASVRQ
ncbi:MAG: cytochrome c peroxidase [Lysobacterales bacterium]